MKIPHKINVMGRNVKILKVKNWEGHEDTSVYLVGRYYPDSQTIYLNTTFNPKVVETFLLHEINHAIMDITGVDQNMSRELQEVVAQSFASFYCGEGKKLYDYNT